MCDTFVDIPKSSSSPIIFGKNSDREPNEAQQIVYIPRQKRSQATVQATYIEVEHVKETYEVILSKPFQMFGAEMGCNEFGLTIGNEAVFTKEKFLKKNSGLTGMDMIRLCLESKTNAKDALEHIIRLNDKYGQDACGGYMDKNFYYHNSFLIADRNEAYQLDTAGKHWVYKKLTGYTAISNGLSITDDYDEISEITKAKDNFNFAKTFSQFWMPRLAYCEYRAQSSSDKRDSHDQFGVLEAFSILRQHKEPFAIDKATPKSICMHSTGITNPSTTAGSMVVAIPKEGKPVVWLTGTSSPCISLFKPFYFGDDILLEENFKKPGALADGSYWWHWEKFYRDNMNSYDVINATLKPLQRKWEKNWLDRVNKNDRQVSRDALEESRKILEKLKNQEYKKQRLGIVFKAYRKKLNRQAGIL